MPNTTKQHLTRRYARAILRLIHPTVPPTSSDVDRIVYALTQYERELTERRKALRSKGGPKCDN